MNGRLSSFLNASRWLAAFLVLTGHVRHLVLADYSAVTARTLFVKGLYFVTGLSHEAVMVFFVISGYLIGGRAIVRYRERDFDLIDYGIHRFSRIYTVLVPALIIGGLLDVLGLKFFNQSALYTASAQYDTGSLNFVISSSLNAPTFLSNLVMLEGVLLPRFGSNNPLWSLVYEWWYYCAFAAAMVLTLKGSVVARILAGIVLIAICLLFPARLVVWGLMWLIGVAAALYGESKFGKPAVWLGLLVFVSVLVATRLSHSSESSGATSSLAAFVEDFGMALAYAFLLLAFRKDGKPLPWDTGHRRLADFSYTLYLLHFPMMVFCVAMLHDIFGVQFLRQPGLEGMLYFGALVGFLFAYSWLVSLATETQTFRVRTLLWGFVRRLGRPMAISPG